MSANRAWFGAACLGSCAPARENDWGADPDAGAPAGGDHRAVAITRVTIELEADVLPVGRVVGADGCALAFAGWTELAAAVEQARVIGEEHEDDVSPSALSGGAS